MLKVICKTTLYRNIGQKTQSESFTKGLEYDMLLSSGLENWQIYPNEGQPVRFNDEDYRNYFEFKPKKRN